MSALSIAIVGFSGLIGKRHVKHVLECKDVELVAVVDPAPAAPAVKKDLGVPDGVPLYTSVPDLLAATTPICALVCTPHETHVRLATQLVEAGVHVLVEKPVSDDVADGRGLVALAREKGVHLLVGHHRRFNPYIVATKRVLDSGALGKVLAVSGLWTTFKPDAYFTADPVVAWRSSRAKGGGVVLNNFVHEADCMQFLFGRIVRVHAEEITPQRAEPDKPDRVEEGVVLTLRFASGTVGTYVLSDGVVSPHNFETGTGENPHIPPVRISGSGDEIDVYRIFGTHGTLSFPDMTLSSYAGVERSWNEVMARSKQEIDNDPRVPLVRQLDHFVRLVRGEEKPSCDGQAGLAALQVCLAILESLEKKGPVDIAE